jgi:alkylated DNA repair dioxygenase AlkB
MEYNLTNLDIGAGDCQYCKSILTEEERPHMFHHVNAELNDLWGQMFHKGGAVPRKIVIQYEKQGSGTFEKFEGMQPIYRHPVDVSPPVHEYTPLVEKIRNRVEDALEFDRGSLNHVLIQLYPDGESHISDHSDKTLDIMKGTPVINVSIGATRKMKIKDKVKGEDGTRKSKRLELNNGSIFVMGWETNRKFYHGINQDKRDDKFKTESELDFDGARISLTFRNIATFVDSEGKLHGQGAVKDSSAHSDETNEEEQLRMLKAFSAENRELDFDWDLHYGGGFNCINFETLN